MIRTIQGDFGPDDSPFLASAQTYGMTGIIAQRSRLNNTVIVEPEPMAEVKSYNVGFEYIPPPEPPVTTTVPPTTTTAPVTTTPIPTTVPPTTTTAPPTTTTSSAPPTSTTTSLPPTSAPPP